MVCNRDLEVARPEYRFNCFLGAAGLVVIPGLASSDSRIFISGAASSDSLIRGCNSTWKSNHPKTSRLMFVYGLHGL